MAQRLYQQFQKTLVKDVVTIYFAFNIGAAGAVVPVQKTSNVGVRSITRTGTGLYVIAFGDAANNIPDRYSEFLNVNINMIINAVPTSPYWVINSTDIRIGGTISIQFYAPTSPSVTTLIAADPNNGLAIKGLVTLRNSVTP